METPEVEKSNPKTKQTKEAQCINSKPASKVNRMVDQSIATSSYIILDQSDINTYNKTPNQKVTYPREKKSATYI